MQKKLTKCDRHLNISMQTGLAWKEAILFAGHFVQRKSFKLIQYNTGPARDCGVFYFRTYIRYGSSGCPVRSVKSLYFGK